MPTSLSLLARRQHGVFSRRQALAAGVSVGRIRGRLRRAEWTEVQPEVYAAASSRLDDRSRLWAAWLAMGPPMAFSGGAAGLLLALSPLPALGPLDIVVTDARGPTLRNVRLRRAPALPKARRVEGLPVLPVADVLVDLGAVLPEAVLLNVVQEALRERRCSESELRQALGRGKRGSATVRRVLAVVGDGAESHWERVLLRGCQARGLEVSRPWLVSPRTRRRMRPDGYVEGVVFEVDGWSAHGGSEQFVADRRRLRALVAELGLDFLSFAAVDVRDQLATCLDDIEETVRRRRRRHG